MPDDKPIILQARPEADAVAELARKGVEARVLTVHAPDGASAEVLVMPSALTVRSVSSFVDENRDAPRRARGTAQLTTLASFVAHVNLFKNPDSAIFADRTPKAPALLAVLDYNRHGPEGEPRYGEHKTRYAFPLSDEWLAWKGAAANVLAQDRFAAFLEDHLTDVADPANASPSAILFAGLFGCSFASASRLLELSRGLSVNVGARVQNHVSLATGETSIAFATAHADEQGAPLKVPGAFLLGIPVFRGGALYQIPARLRYRVGAGTLSWSFEMHRADAVFDHAIDEACEAAERETGLPVFQGLPEEP